MVALKAVIFDVDGTLAETEDVHRLSFNRAFREAGYDWAWNVPLYKELLRVTGGKQRIRHYLERFHPDLVGKVDIPALHARKTELYGDIMAEGAVGLKPGVESLIRALRSDGMTIAIATTTSPENIRALFRATLGEDALSWFAAIGDGANAPKLKPDPEVYRYVLSRLGVDAAACIAIEDSGNGIRAAAAAHVPCLVVRSEFTEPGDTSATLGVVDSLEGLTPAALARLHGGRAPGA